MPATEKQDYRTEISANVTSQEAFDKISRVPEWWGKNFEGKSKKVNDVFTVRFAIGDVYKMRVAEIDPNKRIVWEVVDAFQGWVKKRLNGWGQKLHGKLKEKRMECP